MLHMEEAHRIIQQIEALKVIKSEAEEKIEELRLRLINLLKI